MAGSSGNSKLHLCIGAGTRPEIIKLAPVARAFSAAGDWQVSWVATGQHGRDADRLLKRLGLRPRVRLAPPRRSLSLASRIAHLTEGCDEALGRLAPDMAIVQGDTSTTLAMTLAAFTRRIPVAHVEAGLRTHNLEAPFPEEAWRVVVSALAQLHFAPTPAAARNLVEAGVAPDRVHMTGNTVVDAAQALAADRTPSWLSRLSGRRIVTVTAHRRENWGGGLDRVVAALFELRDRFSDIEIVFVTHANPAVASQIKAKIAGQARMTALPPLDYPDFVALLRASTLALTDSGGVQEEAPTFGVPVLVLRDVTERGEAVEAGVAEVVGTEPASIVAAASRLLSDPDAYAAMARPVSPFGDGHASRRIVSVVQAHFGALRQASPRAA